MKHLTGSTLIAEVPRSLGKVNKIRLEDGRLVCETESGVPFICGQNPRKVIEFLQNFGEGEV